MSFGVANVSYDELFAKSAGVKLVSSYIQLIDQP